MLINEVEDFIVIADDPFPLSFKDAKLNFDVTWKNTKSELIINCREICRKDKTEQTLSKITSMTISEFKGIHNELSAIEPKITPYFPEEFSFKTITIERPNPTKSWGFFSIQPQSIIDEDKEFSDESISNIQNYLRAVVEICGKQLLYNLLFKEENKTYYENNDEFILKKCDININNSKENCIKLLKCHNNFENLQSLTEDLYKEEDMALDKYKETLFERFFLVHSKINEDIECLIDQLQKCLTGRQSIGIGPRIIEELNEQISVILKEYYIKQRLSINLKLEISKSLRSLLSNLLNEMLKDKSKYETVIFRECVGERMKNLSLLYHAENENIAHYNLLLHSAEELIVTRKLTLINKWEEGQEMVKPNVRHEDYSLIQLKNLNPTDLDLSQLDDFHSYISNAYKLLLNYYEARRSNFTNLKQILDDSLNIIPPLKGRTKCVMKSTTKTSIEDNDMFQSIDISGIIDIDDEDSSDEFQDALDETRFEHLMKSEKEIYRQKEELENELKQIASIKAELRNSQHQLQKQYEKLRNNVMNLSNELNDSLNLSSLHPEKLRPVKKLRTNPGSLLSLEQRKIEARKVNERIKNYNKKLKVIQEENKKDLNKSTVKLPDVKPRQSIVKRDPDLTLPVPSPPPPPPPPSIPPPPPPPPSMPPSFFGYPSIPTSNKGSLKIQTDSSSGNIMLELRMKLAKRNSNVMDGDIDIQIKKDKLKANVYNNINTTLSSLVDNRRQHFCYKPTLDDEEEFDE